MSWLENNERGPEQIRITQLSKLLNDDLYYYGAASRYIFFQIFTLQCETIRGENSLQNGR